jgi:ATP-binding cassette subfamily C (CFTR/MRP) protein 4
LDPFRQCSDSQLWQALEQVQMQDAIRQLPLGLSAPLSEGGSNLSVGQRQLLCLARAITRRSRLLIMDEATANVDLDTDAIIQKTIRSRFQDCTVVVIAHRLNTIMDSDRVMVLDHGNMLEFDVPHRLLSNVNGALTKMVSETGAGMARELRRMAFTKYATLPTERGGPHPDEIIMPVSTAIGSASSEDLVAQASIAAPPPMVS